MQIEKALGHKVVWMFGCQAIQKETGHCGQTSYFQWRNFHFVSINHSDHTSAKIVPSAAISPSIFSLLVSQGHIVSGCPLSPGVGVDRSRCQPLCEAGAASLFLSLPTSRLRLPLKIHLLHWFGPALLQINTVLEITEGLKWTQPDLKQGPGM